MRWSALNRSTIVYLTLFGLAFGICGWQVQEHLRFKRTATTALENRAYDITATLATVIRSQRQYGIVFNKQRFETALQDLLQPDGLRSLVILGATGEPIAMAGEPLQLASDSLNETGRAWQGGMLVMLNMTDLDPEAARSGGFRRPTAIVVSEGQEQAMFRRFRWSPRRQNSGGQERAPGESGGGENPGGGPAGMSPAEVQAMMQKQTVHSFVLGFSTAQMTRAVRSDLLQRSLVGVLAVGGAIISALAWRNLARNAELQIRLVKAGEMNTHLKEMNFAAAGLAHETRNPLNLIRGFAQMIAIDPAGSPKLRQHASTIIEEADRVTVQLNEFIDYSKPREAHLAPVAVGRLVADVGRTLLPDIEEKRITLVPPESTLVVEADELLLRQALFNILLNAVQAVNPGGRVEVRLSQAGSREAELTIDDDGPGVPEADRASIFKPYVTMKPNGVGLGLAIVQQIVSAHHWTIVCDTNEWKGARFRIGGMKLAVTPT